MSTAPAIIEIEPRSGPISADILPESAGFDRADTTHSADEYFPKDDAPPVEEKVIAPKVEPKAPVVVAPAKTLGERMLEKKNPPAPPKVDAPPPPPADPVTEIEAKMRTANKNWKPSAGWDELKTVNKTLAEKAAAAEARAAELTTKAEAANKLSGFVPEEIEKLRNEHKEMSDVVLVHRLESHPKFKAEFVLPQREALTRASELLSAHGVDAKNLESLMAKPRNELGKAVQELVQSIPAFDQTEVSESIRRAYDIEQRKRGALAHSKEVLGGIQEQSQARSKQAFESKWAPVLAALNDHMVALEPTQDATPEQRAECEAYNASMRGIRQNAEKIAFGSNSEESVAEAAMKAAAYDHHIAHVQPRLAKEIGELITLNRSLVGELEAMKSRNPNRMVRGNSLPIGDVKAEDMNHAQAADHFFNARP